MLRRIEKLLKANCLKASLQLMQGRLGHCQETHFPGYATRSMPPPPPKSQAKIQHLRQHICFKHTCSPGETFKARALGCCLRARAQGAVSRLFSILVPHNFSYSDGFKCPLTYRRKLSLARITSLVSFKGLGRGFQKASPLEEISQTPEHKGLCQLPDMGSNKCPCKLDAVKEMNPS